MHQEPVLQDPGRDDDPSRVPSWPDWMDDLAYLAARTEDDDLGDLDEGEDPDNAPPPGLDDDELDTLTATPVENRLQDLYEMVSLVAPGLLGTAAQVNRRAQCLPKPGVSQAQRGVSASGQLLTAMRAKPTPSSFGDPAP
jgi:hypothetical protein